MLKPPNLRSAALCAAGTLLFASMSFAADGKNASDAQARYQRDRAACLSGQSSQDRATCLREAGAARDEAKRGRLGDGQAAFEQNRMIRCEPLPQGEREDCQRRMRGEGTTTGSVEGGGIYRELVTPVVPSQDK